MRKNTMTIQKENNMKIKRMITIEKYKYRDSCACRRRKDEFN
ncbi:hypothetical protein SAMN06272722_10145 [Paenibacillus sp. RU5A]|jgi:hypothetical protein|nr:hypothetical protein SAMN06272722_10145 [Paenibacillus sp. RU5A]SOC65436.1 hypothetical protein SAMN05880581_1011146 [Paenibacillus sp. RU26A]SOC68648.1 hypothetical protein SAMN05880586_1011145 [Paenibacillus sp. RU5M]